MKYVIHYDIAALVIFAITSVVFFVKKRVPCKRNKVFAALLGISAASTLFDISSVLVTVDQAGREFKMFLHIAYYVTHSMVPFWFVIYILFLSERLSEINTVFRIRLYLPIAANLLLIVTSPFTKWIISIDETGAYKHGPLQPVCYAIAIYYLAFGVVYALESRKMMARQALFSVLSFIGLTLIAVFIQMINQYLLVESFASALCVMLVMFILQNQDDMIDSGTKMLNRNSFVNTCMANLSSDTPFSLLLIRIPDFSLLIRTFGIRSSHALLKSFANYLYKYVELGNGYYLEDECFALTYFKNYADKVSDVYKNIRERLEKVWKLETLDTMITACFLKIDCPADTSDIDMIMEYIEHFKHMNAVNDHLLYASEINIYDHKHRGEVERAIEKGIENKSFQVHYQPIYSAAKKRIVSCEALIRLYDDELGRIRPDEFIAIAEQNGSIVKIGEMVFEEACRFIQQGDVLKLGIEYIEVNLSVVQCMQTELADKYMEIMEQYNVSPSNICLEITESAAAYTPHVMERNIKKLSEYGINMALDDYGTGYSNMSYLLNMPFKFLKLDRGMMMASLERSKARIAIESTIAMTKKLNMQLVAEGIETQEQIDKVLDMGCDFIQGNYFSKPVPADEFIEVLKRHTDTKA